MLIDPLDMKLAVSTANTPYVLRNFQLEWEIFRLSFDEWCQQMDQHLNSQPVQFTSGTMTHCDIPYWEKFRTHEHFRFNEFAKKTKKNEFSERWHSHSYRDIISWPNSLKESISFKKLGFERTEDILFWLGSRGANTPCHYDTYGFNIVVQIFGHKNWLLFPPDAPLTATRVPFEESSVYCKENFFSPCDMKQFDEIGHNRDAYEVTLGPRDILIVPANWWHYVENLDTSLTVNTWIPLKKDALARLAECFVRMHVEQITADDTDFDGRDIRNHIYNPNEMNEPDLNLMNLFKPLADAVLAEEDDPLASIEIQEKGQQIREKFDNIFHRVEPLSHERFRQILLQKSSRYDSTMDHRKINGMKFKEVENIINAICHPKTVDSACQLYLQQIRNETIQNETIL